MSVFVVGCGGGDCLLGVYEVILGFGTLTLTNWNFKMSKQLAVIQIGKTIHMYEIM